VLPPSLDRAVLEKYRAGMSQRPRRQFTRWLVPRISFRAAFAWSAAVTFAAIVSYAAIVLLMMVQFLRPTILGWLMSLALFALYTVEIFLKATSRESRLSVDSKEKAPVCNAPGEAMLLRNRSVVSRTPGLLGPNARIVEGLTFSRVPYWSSGERLTTSPRKSRRFPILLDLSSIAVSRPVGSTGTEKKRVCPESNFRSAMLMPRFSI